MHRKTYNEKRYQGNDKKDSINKILYLSMRSKVSQIVTHTEENIIKQEEKMEFQSNNIGYREIKDFKNINISEKEISLYSKNNSAEMKNISNIKKDSLHSMIDSSLLFNKIDNLVIKIDEYIEVQKQTNETQKKANEEQKKANEEQKKANEEQRKTNELLMMYIKNQEQILKILAGKQNSSLYKFKKFIYF